MGEEYDYWLLKLNANLEVVFSRNFGGGGDSESSGSSVLGNIVVKNNQLYFFSLSQSIEEMPTFDVECGHYNPTDSRSKDAWLVAFDLPTAIEDYFPHKNNIQLYPNPADKFTSVRIAGNESFEYQVFSSTGLLISEGNVNSINTQINTADLQNGIYYIRFIQSVLPSKTFPLIIIH